MASMKKGMKYRSRPRNGCDGRSVTKILIMTIQMNLCYLIPFHYKLVQNSRKLSLIIKFLSLTYHDSHFLAATCKYFTTFFILAILQRVAPFFTVWLFLSGYHIFCKLYNLFFSFAEKESMQENVEILLLLHVLHSNIVTSFFESCFSLLNNIYIINTSSIVLHSNTLIKQTLFI